VRVHISAKVKFYFHSFNRFGATRI